jgi:hypothetical protein
MVLMQYHNVRGKGKLSGGLASPLLRRCFGLCGYGFPPVWSASSLGGSRALPIIIFHFLAFTMGLGIKIVFMLNW